MDFLNTGLQTTDSKIYFLSVDTRERLEIQFVPASVSPDRTAEIATLRVVGRNTPKYQNVGGEDVLSLDLDFYADEDNRVSVVQKCNWLRSLTYMNGNKKAAQRVVLIWGNLFKKEVWLVRKVTPVYSNFDKTHDLMPNQANVRIDLCLDIDYNVAWSDINVDYVRGANDGANPLKPKDMKLEEQDESWKDVTNDNSFEAQFNRAKSRLRI